HHDNNSGSKHHRNYRQHWNQHRNHGYGYYWDHRNNWHDRHWSGCNWNDWDDRNWSRSNRVGRNLGPNRNRNYSSNWNNNGYDHRNGYLNHSSSRPDLWHYVYY